MVHRKSYSVQQKMTLIIFLVSVFVLLLTSVQFAAIELKRIRDAAYADASSLARLISANARFAMKIKDFPDAESVLRSLAARKDVVSSHLLLPNGQSVVRYSRSQVSHARLDTAAEVEFYQAEARQIADGVKAGKEKSWQEGGRVAHFLPISFEGSLVGYLYLSLELLDMRKQQLSLAMGWLLVMGPVLLVTYLLSARLQRHISRPVEQLALRMGQIASEKRLVGFEPKDTDDEFKLLFHGFDEMMHALKERDQLLERHRKDLELEVQVRTRALEVEKEKAEQATIAKSRFLANMSHEIRTPMIGVLGMADLLQQRELAEQDRPLVETIYRSGEALLAILNDVLDFSKIEAGRLELYSVPVDVAQLAEEVTRLMEINAQGKGVELTLGSAANLPLVMGDPGRIRQILLNLIGNAIKFTERGSVTVSLSGKARTAGGMCDLVMEVRDTGVGIPDELRLRIFDSFDQGDSTMARKSKGTGLGLSITRELVQLMHGEIRVASSPGLGSSFTVHLPMLLANPSAAVAPARSYALEQQAASQEWSKGGGSERNYLGRHILLAEDNPTTQDLLSILMGQMGIKLSIVDNGQSAIDFLETQTVDLIFMDCQMPQLDGFEATAHLRARGMSTPIIALTAYALEEDERQCLSVGMNDFLSKPFRQSDLKAVLSRWLDAAAVAQTATADSACWPPGHE